jgi:hypothetical protein
MGSCMSAEEAGDEGFMYLGVPEDDSDLLAKAAMAVVRPEDGRYFILFSGKGAGKFPEIYIQDTQAGGDGPHGFKYYVVPRDWAGIIKEEACFFGEPMTKVITLNQASSFCFTGQDGKRKTEPKTYYILAADLAKLAEVPEPAAKPAVSKQD